MDMPKITTGATGSAVYRTCRARVLIDASPFDADTREGIWRYIDVDTNAPGVAAAPALSKYLVSQGIPLSTDAIRRHRRRECACANRKDTDD